MPKKNGKTSQQTRKAHQKRSTQEAIRAWRKENEPPVWVDVTPETVISPNDLVRVANILFNGADLLEAPHNPDAATLRPYFNLYSGSLPDKPPYHLFDALEAMPAQNVIEARISFDKHEMQAGRVDDAYRMPTYLTGACLSTNEVSRNTGIPVAMLEQEADNLYGCLIADPEFEDADGNYTFGFYAEQFNPDGTMNEHVAQLIPFIKEYIQDDDGIFVNLFNQRLLLGYVSPIAYVSLGAEYLEAFKTAYELSINWARYYEGVEDEYYASQADIPFYCG